jgi:molybdopterin molybdotransferase
MLELEEASARILAAVPAPQAERVPLQQAHRRIATAPIVAPIDLPIFDNSSVDGYAVRAADVAAATSEAPVRLRLAGRAAAGEVFRGQCTAGGSVRVFTGSPLPSGAGRLPSWHR